MTARQDDSLVKAGCIHECKLELQGTRFVFQAVDLGEETVFTERFRLVVRMGHMVLTHTIIESQRLSDIFKLLADDQGIQEAAELHRCYHRCTVALINHANEKLEPMRAAIVQGMYVVQGGLGGDPDQ